MQINNQRTQKISNFDIGKMCIWIYLLGFICTAQLAAGTAMDMTKNGLNCTVVRPIFEARGINPIDLPKEPIKGKCFMYYLTLC